MGSSFSYKCGYITTYKIQSNGVFLHINMLTWDSKIMSNLHLHIFVADWCPFKLTVYYYCKASSVTYKKCWAN